MSRPSVETTRRQYNAWVATETLEDYALRYAPSSFRKWSPLLLANTSIGSISFLALEAIGATLLLGFGYTNSVWAILFASIIIFAAGLPISYYAARYNIDIDLLTRSAGFGYVGSTITSLIYASFCFIFFALEAAIMAQALKLYFELPLYLGYILCSLVIIPIVFYGITAINRLHLWTQPIWLLLMLLPLYFLYTQNPNSIKDLMHFQGRISGSNAFDPYYFGIAAGISFSLIAQIGEQVDYLRFMPDKSKSNRSIWWASLLAAGPGWIVLGCFKQLAGVLLVSLAVLSGLAYAEAKEPVQMYYVAYSYVFDQPGIALLVSTVFVLISQIKINVTNAYAGSLAWSNFFSRVTHAHPGRVVWLIFNIGIALLLMELGVFEALQKVLGLYSNFAIAWIAVVVADLTINKPLKLSPPIVEFKRAHLYDYNPVGVASMSIAALLSTIAFTGLFGRYAEAYSWLISLTAGFMLAPLIAFITQGKYYLARKNVHFPHSDELVRCGACDQHYAQTDFAFCSFYRAPICSLCCTLTTNCKDQCKPQRISLYRQAALHLLDTAGKYGISSQSSSRMARFTLLSGAMIGVMGVTFWLLYSGIKDQFPPEIMTPLSSNLSNLFYVLAVLICILSWWIVLGKESQALAETELKEQNHRLDIEIADRKAIEQALNDSTAELALHNEILQLINQGNNLPAIFNQLAHRAEALHPGMLCSILLLDESGKYFRHGAAPSLPDFYNHAIDGLEIGDQVGSCGTAAFRGERVIVEDIQQHPYWSSFRDLAHCANVKSCWSQPVKNNKGQVLGTFAIYRRQIAQPSPAEISLIEQYANLVLLAVESDQAELNLRLAATAFESHEGMLVTDAKNLILRVNQAFTKITGYSAEDVIGKNPRLLSSGRQDAEFYAAMWDSIHRSGKWDGEIWNRRKNGEIFPEYLTITAVKDANGIISHYIATLTDITARKKAENEIERLAFYDPLTGLPNRRLLFDRLKLILASSYRSGQIGALLFIDLDNFKILNDTLGHDMGDILLRQVAERLSACVRECDTVVRLGGDEFVVLLEDLGEPAIGAARQAEIVGNKILNVLNQPYRLANYDYRSTPSIGATLFNGQNRNIDELIKQADIAMYQAKEAGRNTLSFFDPAMQTAIMARSGLESDLRQGLEKKQFVLHYQPQVDGNNRITGAKVLVRWQHPLRGQVLPTEFIPLAEETGLILPLGLWILDTACTQLATWAAQQETAHLTLAVNISVHQFRQADFADQVSEVLDRTGADPGKLRLEFSESLLTTHIEDIVSKMASLKVKGVRLSLNNFGSSYPSFSCLKQLQLDQLKINQSFVKDILTDRNDAAIVKMIVALAENMGQEVMAEGVETENQRNFLASHGCSAYQGYLFSRPLPLEAFESCL
jgi:diguanylate cyclase (GGDEF)-like protein/PAS domain S-box-containing protein